jgi:streptomycin 6-kinase
VIESAAMGRTDAQAVTVPARLRHALLESQVPGAREWVDRVPGLVAELLERWSCVVAGRVMAGWAGIVVPVRRANGGGAMLKLSSPTGGPHVEAITLAAWAGRGAALLLERDDANYAMLLEQLRPESLATVTDSDDAMAIAGRLARRLAVPAPPELPRMQPHLERWASDLPAMSAAAGHPFPARVVDAAVATCAELGPDQPETVQHGDLSQQNVLRGTREGWLAIDPIGQVGEIAFECLTHIRDRWIELRHVPDPAQALRRRIEIFAEAAEIDVTRARRWTQARAVQSRVRGPYDVPMDDGGVHDWIATTLSD